MQQACYQSTPLLYISILHAITHLSRNWHLATTTCHHVCDVRGLKQQSSTVDVLFCCPADVFNECEMLDVLTFSILHHSICVRKSGVRTWEMQRFIYEWMFFVSALLYRHECTIIASISRSTAHATRAPHSSCHRVPHSQIYYIAALTLFCSAYVCFMHVDVTVIQMQW